MSTELPNIEFRSNHIKDYGIEIITIKNLMERKDVLDHDPEKAHRVDFNLIVFYAEGNTKHLVDFVWHKIHKNTIIYLSRGQVNAFKFNDSVKGFIILFTDEYFKKQLNTLPKNEVIRIFNSHLFSPKIEVPGRSQLERYINLFFDEFVNEKTDFNKQNIYGALYAIIFSKLEQLKQYQTLHLKNSNKFELFLAFKNLLEVDYIQSKNADYYATKLNITYKHLNAVSKEMVNTTAKKFIDQFVILEAKRKLINSSIKSNELAFDLGFNEPTNFVKYFKRFTGSTPNMFKKQFS